MTGPDSDNELEAFLVLLTLESSPRSQTSTLLRD